MGNSRFHGYQHIPQWVHGRSPTSPAHTVNTGHAGYKVSLVSSCTDAGGPLPGSREESLVTAVKQVWGYMIVTERQFSTVVYKNVAYDQYNSNEYPQYSPFIKYQPYLVLSSQYNESFKLFQSHKI